MFKTIRKMAGRLCGRGLRPEAEERETDPAPVLFGNLEGLRAAVLIDKAIQKFRDYGLGELLMPGEKAEENSLIEIRPIVNMFVQKTSYVLTLSYRFNGESRGARLAKTDVSVPGAKPRPTCYFLEMPDYTCTEDSKDSTLGALTESVMQIVQNGMPRAMKREADASSNQKNHLRLIP